MNFNILSIIDSFEPGIMGGAARVFYDVNNVLLEKGHTVHAICRMGEIRNRLEEGKGPKGIKREVVFHAYPDIEGSQLKKIKYYGRSIKKLFNEYLAENKPDFIIIHSSSAVFGLYEDLKKIDIPIIYYFHSPWNKEYEIIADKKCCGIQSPIVSILSAVRKRHEKKYLKLASGIITLSESMQNILLDVHPEAKNKKLLIDPGAANENVYYPETTKEGREEIKRELALPEDSFCIITSRRLVPRTGVDVLIKAFAELKKELGNRHEGIGEEEKEHRTSNIEHPTSNEEKFSNASDSNAPEIKNLQISKSPNLKLILTGGGTSADSLKQLAKDLGVGEDVIFTGHVSEEDLAKYYRCSDLFVMPTKLLEGFGLSTVEAMASGLPVIGTDIGGTPEILKKISDELVIPECSVDAIAGKLREFVEKDDLDTWREKSIQCFNDNFTWKKHVGKLLEFLKNII